MVEHLLRERISLRGICRAVGVSLMWFLRLMGERLASCPDHLYVQLPVHPTDVVIQRLAAEADEPWSFVGKQANTPWIWSAMDAKTCQIMAFHLGDRRGERGEQRWSTLTPVSRQQATFYTDVYAVY